MQPAARRLGPPGCGRGPSCEFAASRSMTGDLALLLPLPPTISDHPADAVVEVLHHAWRHGQSCPAGWRRLAGWTAIPPGKTRRT
jgi:hypothetical protein